MICLGFRLFFFQFQFLGAELGDGITNNLSLPSLQDAGAPFVVRFGGNAELAAVSAQRPDKDGR